MKPYFYIFIVVVLCMSFFGWLDGSSGLLLGGDRFQMLIALARLAGILAVLGALIQLMLMGRVAWFSDVSSQKVHHYNGFLTVIFVLFHPLLLGIGYSGAQKISYFAQMMEFLTQWEDVALAAVAGVLFCTVALLSITAIRRKLRYKMWHSIHLSVYVAVLLAFGHQVEVGSDMTGWFKIFWYFLYSFVALNVGYYRLWPLLQPFLKRMTGNTVVGSR